MQHPLKLGGINYHFRWVKIAGATSLMKGLNYIYCL